MANNLLNVHVVKEEDITTPHATQKYPLGMEICVRTEGTLNFVKYKYVVAHGNLTAYQPYSINHTGTALSTAAPATGAAQIGVPQVAFTSAYYGFVVVEGEATCKIGAETYAVGDHLEILNAGTTAVVDGTSGSTVRSVKSFAVSKAAGTVAASISIYMFGEMSDVSAS